MTNPTHLRPSYSHAYCNMTLKQNKHREMSIPRSAKGIVRLHSGTVACRYHRWSIVIQRAVSTRFHPSLLVQAQYFLITWVKQQRIKTCALYILRWHSKAQPRMRHTAHCLLCKASIANAKQFMRMKFKQSIILKFIFGFCTAHIVRQSMTVQESDPGHIDARLASKTRPTGKAAGWRAKAEVWA